MPNLPYGFACQAVRLKQQHTGDDMAASATPDVGARPRKRISAADDAKAAARVLAATARIAVAGVNDTTVKRIRLSGKCCRAVVLLCKALCDQSPRGPSRIAEGSVTVIYLLL